MGLDRRSKYLPSQFFYDEEGSRLFEEICELPEYYLTRAETEILESHAADFAVRLPTIESLVELGSGSAVKTEHLLRAFEEDERQLRYVPIDVSASALEASVARIEMQHPQLEILPVLAEYETGLEAIQDLDLGPMLTIWLGSSIGNLDRESAGAFLARHRETMTSDDRLLVGIDLRKEPRVLERAYDDDQGITARFDMNLLARINRELNGSFDLSCFRHRVRYDEASGSVQSFLESQCEQRVRIDDLDLEVRFADGERIHTEDSLKYSPEEIDALAASAQLRLDHRAVDEQGRFSLNLFEPDSER
jgi:dimethylhistidine N-methyltransferase